MTEQDADAPLAAEPGLAARRGGKARPSRKGREPDAGGGSSGGFGKLVLTVLVLGLIGAGALLYLQQQRLDQAQADLQRADERLRQLENRLQMTDEAFSEAGSEVQSQLSFWESEIRKLWDVSNVRNRGWIQENQEKLRVHETRLAELGTQLASANSKIAAHEQVLGQQRALRERLDALELELRAQSEQQRQLAEQLAAARQNLTRLEGLPRRVETHDQAIAAIDAYRQQVNARLTELSNRLEALAAR